MYPYPTLQPVREDYLCLSNYYSVEVHLYDSATSQYLLNYSTFFPSLGYVASDILPSGYLMVFMVTNLTLYIN
jgi:hypothetical protein